MEFDTVANIVSEAAVSVGLGTVSDVFASTDANVVRLRTLLKSVGRKLVRERRWSHLVLEHTFATTATASYVLPSDFRALVPSTGWDRTDDWPVGGPLDGEQWQYIASGSVTPTRLYLRFWRGAIYVQPSTDTGTTVAFEYGTTLWVATTGSTTPSLDGPTANTDVVLFDPDLFIAALKLAWLNSVGLPADAAAADYVRALEAAARDDVAARAYPIGRAPDGLRLLSGANVPDSGWV